MINETKESLFEISYIYESSLCAEMLEFFYKVY